MQKPDLRLLVCWNDCTLALVVLKSSSALIFKCEKQCRVSQCCCQRFRPTVRKTENSSSNFSKILKTPKIQNISFEGHLLILRNSELFAVFSQDFHPNIHWELFSIFQRRPNILSQISFFMCTILNTRPLNVKEVYSAISPLNSPII